MKVQISTLIWGVFSLSLFLFATGYCMQNAKNSSLQITRTDRYPTEPSVMIGDNNWRGPQLDRQDFTDFIKEKGIKRVIRLNGERGVMSLAKEKKVCGQNVDFHYFNIESFDTKKDFEPLFELLDKGDTFIHCKHGFDRTGSVVAAYMRGYGFSTDEILFHNHWENYIEEKGSSYKKYYSTVNL